MHRTPFPAYGSCCLRAGIEGWGNGVRSARLWARLLGLSRVVVECVDFDEAEEAVVVSVRPRKATKRRCRQCGKRCPGYDRGRGRRRWRVLDLGTVRASWRPFAHTQANRIEAGTELNNMAEQRALAKAGFTREGVMRGAAFQGGRWHDAVIYSILRQDLTATN